MNRLGQRGETDLGWDSAAYAARACAFGWHAIELDGHDLGAIDRAYAEALAPKDRPTCLIARTEKGAGVAFVDNKEQLARQGLQPGAGESGHRRAGRRASSHHPDLQAGGPGAGRRARRAAAQAARLRGRRQGGDAQGLRRRAGRRRRQPAGGGRPGWRGFQLDLRRGVQERLSPTGSSRCSSPSSRLVTAAVGLAVLGKRVFASTFAAFFTRAYDQIRMAAISNATIHLVGSHAGVSIGEDGPSQMGLEDLAMMRGRLRQHGPVSLRPESDGAARTRRWWT